MSDEKFTKSVSKREFRLLSEIYDLSINGLYMTKYVSVPDNTFIDNLLEGLKTALNDKFSEKGYKVYGELKFILTVNFEDIIEMGFKIIVVTPFKNLSYLIYCRGKYSDVFRADILLGFIEDIVNEVYTNINYKLDCLIGKEN